MLPQHREARRYPGSRPFRRCTALRHLSFLTGLSLTNVSPLSIHAGSAMVQKHIPLSMRSPPITLKTRQGLLYYGRALFWYASIPALTAFVICSFFPSKIPSPLSRADTTVFLTRS